MTQQAISYRSTMRWNSLRAIRAMNSSGRNAPSSTAACSTWREGRAGSTGACCSGPGTWTCADCTIMRKDGSFVQVLKNASRLEDEHGRVIGGVETITDITEIVQKDQLVTEFHRQLQPEGSFQGIIGISPAMLQVFSIIRNAARSDAPVLILGESGTGKELVSKAIHRLSGRSKAPLVSVNCAALAESLLESELFGHVKGA